MCINVLKVYRKDDDGDVVVDDVDVEDSNGYKKVPIPCIL